MTLHLVGNWPSDTGYAWKMIERLWINLARAYPGRTILTFPKVTTISRDLQSSNIEIIEFDFNFSRPNEIVEFVRTHQIRHIYLSDRNYISPVYARLRMAGVRSITLHDHTPGIRSLPCPLKRFGKALAVRLMGADTYIATTPWVRQRHLNVVCAPEDRCRVATNGIEPNSYSRTDSTIRQDLGISDDTVLIASCSRASPYKRIHLIVEAAAIVVGLRSKVCFIHIGKGPDEQYFRELQALISRKGLSAKFRLLGDRDDVSKILPACDVGVHASEGEVGYSLATLEMMSAGLPVVVPDDPSVAGCIEDGVTGCYFEPGNRDRLVSRLMWLIDNEEVRHEIGILARQSVNSSYTFAETIKATVVSASKYWPSIVIRGEARAR